MDMVVCFLLGSIALSAVIIAANVSLIYKRIEYFTDVFHEYINLKSKEDNDNEEKCI